MLLRTLSRIPVSVFDIFLFNARGKGISFSGVNTHRDNVKFFSWLPGQVLYGVEKSVYDQSTKYGAFVYRGFRITGFPEESRSTSWTESPLALAKFNPAGMRVPSFSLIPMSCINAGFELELIALLLVELE